jgi:hypothetical protein
MKPTKNVLFSALILAAVAATGWAQTVTASNTPPNSSSVGHAAATPAPAPTPAPPITAADVQALKDALAAQQQQIQALQQQLNQKNQGTQAPSTAQDSPKSDASQPANPPQQVAALSTPTADSSSSSSSSSSSAAPQDPAAGSGQSGQDEHEVYNKDMEGPLTLRFRGIHITPGGFVAAEFVRRSRALGSDVTTPFNNLTMPGAAQSNLSEFFASARQSRPTVYISAKAGNVDLSGYVSGDFLSSGVTSTATQTNSYTFRIRQAWAQAKFQNGWSFLGGQAWSLLTENKFEIGPSDDTGRTNDSRPMTIDSQYNVGFTFARQATVRLTKTFNDKVAIAFGVENSQATVTTHENTDDYVLVQAGTNNNYNSTATYGFNPSPDLIAKIAFDPGFGHYEVFGLYDRFQDRIYPCENYVTAGTPPVAVNTLPNCPSLANAGTTTGAYNSSKNGGGFGANARWTFANKHIVFGLHGFGGSGVGRYGAAQLSDVSINADGTVHLIKDLQGLATLEWHGKKLDVYSYVGSEYAQRTYGYDPVQNDYVGYGAPTFNNSGCYTETAPATGSLTGTTPLPGALAHCTADTRDVTEGTIGFWYRFINGPRGRFQWGTQYSYVNRATWSGGANEPHGLDSMIFTSFRYYLP